MEQQKLGTAIEQIASNVTRAATLAIAGLLGWTLMTLQDLSVETAVIKTQLSDIQRRIERQEARPCACNRSRQDG